MAVDFLRLIGDSIRKNRTYILISKKGVHSMKRNKWLESQIEDMENKGYGCVFADLISGRQVPYEMFTDEMLQCVTALYFVEITDSIFENGLESLDGISYIKIEI